MWEMEHSQEKGPAISFTPMILILRWKETRELKPHHPFTNLALEDSSSADVPRLHSQGGAPGIADMFLEPEGEVQTVLPPLIAFHVLRGTCQVIKGNSFFQRERATLSTWSAVVWSTGTLHQELQVDTQEIRWGYWVDLTWAHSKELQAGVIQVAFAYPSLSLWKLVPQIHWSKLQVKVCIPWYKGDVKIKWNKIKSPVSNIWALFQPIAELLTDPVCLCTHLETLQ